MTQAVVSGQIAAKNAGTASSTTQAFAGNVTAGNLIFVIVAWNGTATVSSVADGGLGNTYTQTDAKQAWGTADNVQGFYAKNINGGACTITVTLSLTSVSYLEVYQMEVSGSDTTAPLDAHNTSSGTTNDPASGNLVTGTANEMIIGYCANMTAGAGYTSDSTFDSNQLEHKVVSSTGTYTATFVGDGSSGWGMVAATFKAAAAAVAAHGLAALGVGK